MARCGGFIVKTVLLWRHAKSSWPLDGTSDEKRRLPSGAFGRLAEWESFWRRATGSHRAF